MKLNMNKMIVLVCVLIMGCQENVKENPDKPVINRQVMGTYNDIALENAIISQHTLYPYHFVNNGAELNELGKRDLAVLIRHFTKEAGHLNIRKHNISTELYKARVESVQKRLEEADISMDRISVSDYMPGGSGIASESILVILSQEDEVTTTEVQTLY
jgi:hypothetical protein